MALLLASLRSPFLSVLGFEHAQLPSCAHHAAPWCIHLNLVFFLPEPFASLRSLWGMSLPFSQSNSWKLQHHNTSDLVSEKGKDHPGM